MENIKVESSPSQPGDDKSLFRAIISITPQSQIEMELLIKAGFKPIEIKKEEPNE